MNNELENDRQKNLQMESNKMLEEEKKELILPERKSQVQLNSDDQVKKDIHQFVNERQLIIINDLANINNVQEADYKQELKVELSQQLKKGQKDSQKKISQVNHKFQHHQHHHSSEKNGIRKYTDIDKGHSCEITVFKPDQVIRVVWDLFTMLFIFHEILLLPVDLSFQLDSDYLKYMNYVTIGVFSTDILINFNTAYQFKGAYIVQRRQIARNYLKLWFWIDLGSSFPFDLIIDSVQVDENEQNNTEALRVGVRILRVLKFFRFIKVMKLLRVLKLKKLFGKLEDYIDLSSAMITIYELLKLVFMMLFVAHWLACIWHLIADYEEKAGIDSWLTSQHLVDKPWETKYIASVYWATTTMTTVGYGDIVPFTSIEKIFGIIVMLLACCIFAYIMNSIGGIFVSMDQNEKLIRQKMGQANQFLKSNDIPKDLQARVRKYLEYKYERESSQVDEKQALLVLSSSLRDEVLAEVNIRLIKEAKIFRPKYSDDVLVQLPFLLEEQIYGPEECIFLEGEDGREQENGENIDERCIYFLNKGQVMLCIQRTFTQLKILEKGKTFGELGFFSNSPRSASAYTLDFVYVQKLKKKDFLQILKQQDEQNQKFLMDKHCIDISNDYSPLNLKCFGCSSIMHFANNCPQLHYVPTQQEKFKLVEKYNEEEKIKNKQRQRHEKVRYNAIGYLQLTQEVAKEINFVYKKVQEENGEEDEKQQHMEKKQLIYNISVDSDEIQEQADDNINKTQQQIQNKNDEKVVAKYYEYFDRVKSFKEHCFFDEYNIEQIIKEYNPIAEKKLNMLKTESKLNHNINRTISRSVQRVFICDNYSEKMRWPRSSSAERAEFFEKLIESQGGPESFLARLNEQEDY